MSRTRSARSAPISRAASSRPMFSSWAPCSALVDGREERLRQPLALAQADRQRDAADGAGSLVVLPAGAGEVAANDDLDREDLDASAEHHPPAQLRGRIGARDELRRQVFRSRAEEVIRDDSLGSREPEPRESRQHPALVRDLGRQDDVERRQPVRRDEQQPIVADGVEVANLAGSQERVGGRANGRHGSRPPGCRVSR